MLMHIFEGSHQFGTVCTGYNVCFDNVCFCIYLSIVKIAESINVLIYYLY